MKHAKMSLAMSSALLSVVVRINAKMRQSSKDMGWEGPVAKSLRFFNLEDSGFAPYLFQF